MNKVLIGACLLLTQTSAFALFGKKAKEPEELTKLKKATHQVSEYQSFDEISRITPVPSKFRLGLGAIIRMGVFRSQNINYEVATPDEYNKLEKQVATFFDHPSALRSLKLVSYARQLNANSPYDINTFLPYFTLRDENALFANEKTGPAAVVSDSFKIKGKVEGEVEYITPKGEKKHAMAEYKASSLPQTGVMLLFDADFLSVQELIARPKENVLQDVILHEFTHIWHNELLSESKRMESVYGSSATENGHDAMIVSNPYLAFGEGLAEGLEAIYGTVAVQYGLLSKEEREQFFGRFTQRARKGLDFLVNRQSYIRRNSYLYNLYDYNNCSLRKNDSINAANMDMTRIYDYYNWEKFQSKFYSDENMASTTYLMENCEIDSPSRLESKEGFIATIIYNLLYSGAMVDDKKLELGESVSFKGRKGQEAFRKFVALDESLFDLLNQSKARNLASDNSNLKNAERIFLQSFRGLVLAIKKSEAIRLSDLVGYLLSSKDVSTNVKMKVAYQLMKVTKGSWFIKKDQADEVFAGYFKTPALIKENLASIQEHLIRMSDDGRLKTVMGTMNSTPDIIVTFPSHFYGLQAARRINVNAAYHIDLIDMFGVANEKLTALAEKMAKGFVFKSEKEFIEFADTLGKKDIAMAMLKLGSTGQKEALNIRKSGLKVKVIDKQSL